MENDAAEDPIVPEEGEKKTLLLLDDEKDILKALTRILRFEYDVVSFNEDLKIFAGNKADRFDQEIIKLTMYDEIKGPKATIKMKKIWTVNRVTGVFTKEIYSKLIGRDTSWGSADTIRYDCRKAKKKF